MSESFADDLLKGLRQVSHAFKRQNLCEPHSIIVPAQTLSYMNMALPNQLCSYKPVLTYGRPVPLTLMGYQFLPHDKFNAVQTAAAQTALHEIEAAMQKYYRDRI